MLSLPFTIVFPFSRIHIITLILFTTHVVKSSVWNCVWPWHLTRTLVLQLVSLSYINTKSRCKQSSRPDSSTSKFTWKDFYSLWNLLYFHDLRTDRIFLARWVQEVNQLDTHMWPNIWNTIWIYVCIDCLNWCCLTCF